MSTDIEDRAADHRKWHDEDDAEGGKSVTCWKCAGQIPALIGRIHDLREQAETQKQGHKTWRDMYVEAHNRDLASLRAERDALRDAVNEAEDRANERGIERDALRKALETVTELADYPHTMETGVWDGPRFIRLLREIALAASPERSSSTAAPKSSSSAAKGGETDG